MATDTSALYNPAWIERFYKEQSWWRKILARLPTERWKFTRDEYDAWLRTIWFIEQTWTK